MRQSVHSLWETMFKWIKRVRCILFCIWKVWGTWLLFCYIYICIFLVCNVNLIIFYHGLDVREWVCVCLCVLFVWYLCNLKRPFSTSISPNITVLYAYDIISTKMGIFCENSAFSFWPDVLRMYIFSLFLFALLHIYGILFDEQLRL